MQSAALWQFFLKLQKKNMADAGQKRAINGDIIRFG